MKKFVVFTLISAMTAGAVFAQVADGISFQAWGRGAVVPLRVEGPATQNGKQVDKDAEPELKAGTGTTWSSGANPSRVDFRMQGNASYAGFKFNATAEQNDLMGGDDGAYLWVKPFKNDYLKLTAGFLVDDTLRGKVGMDGFTNFVNGAPGDEDAIFSRFGTSHGWTTFTNNSGGNGGFMLSSKPNDDLFIGLLVSTDSYASQSAEDAYRNMQIGFGYNIGGIGHVRAQWFGGYLGEDPEKDEDKAFNPSQPARIELAFALTALDGLLLDIGTKLYMPVSGKSGYEKSNGVQVSMGATYRNQAFNMVGRVDAKGIGAHDHPNKSDKSTSGMDLDVRLVPAYDLDFATVGAHLAANFQVAGDDAKGKTPDDNVTTKIGFGAFIGRSLGNGNVKAGLSFTTGPIYTGDKLKNESASGYIFQIPIILEYAFF